MYMSELLTRRRDSCLCPLRDHGSLASKYFNTRTGDHACGICAPLWNTLLETISSSSTMSLVNKKGVYIYS